MGVGCSGARVQVGGASARARELMVVRDKGQHLSVKHATFPSRHILN